MLKETFNLFDFLISFFLGGGDVVDVFIKYFVMKNLSNDR